MSALIERPDTRLVNLDGEPLHRYPSAWSAHRHKACALGCWYCGMERKIGHLSWTVIPSDVYAQKSDKRQRDSIKTNVLGGKRHNVRRKI